MAKSMDPHCRLCRAEKTKLYFKGHKCETAKCPVERRSYPPGQHGRARKRILGYAIQLREKQKLKRYYGMSEEQFLLFFKRAERMKGITGENLLSMLERRLDNVIYLAGFSHSRSHARQLVGHGHFRVNDRKVDIPSFLVRPGDVVTVRPRAVPDEGYRAIIEANRSRTTPGWLTAEHDAVTIRVNALPARQDVTLPVEEHLVVELYSK